MAIGSSYLPKPASLAGRMAEFADDQDRDHFRIGELWFLSLPWQVAAAVGLDHPFVYQVENDVKEVFTTEVMG